MLAVNSVAWLLYGCFVQKYYVSFPNLIGLEFMLYYLFLTYHLHSDAQRKMLRNIILAGFGFVILVAMVAFVSFSEPGESFQKGQNALGLTAVIVLVIFYSSPLSNLVHVVRSRDASSIGLGLAIASGINGFLWASYGFAVNDLVRFCSAISWIKYVSLPNFLGILSSIIQIALLFIFRKSKRREDQYVESVDIERTESKGRSSLSE